MMHPQLFSSLSIAQRGWSSQSAWVTPRQHTAQQTCWQQEGTLVLKLCLLGDLFSLGEGGQG